MPEEVATYDWKKTLSAAGKDLVHSLVGVVGFAVATFLADPEHWSKFVAAVPAQYTVLAGLAASSAAAAFRNWLKNSGR